jgi:hypothetical protein
MRTVQPKSTIRGPLQLQSAAPGTSPTSSAAPAHGAHLPLSEGCVQGRRQPLSAASATSRRAAEVERVAGEREPLSAASAIGPRLPDAEPGPIQFVARVGAIDGDGVRLCDAAGERLARRARSCLVAPVVDDLVLGLRLPDGRAYLLAVLERDGRELSLQLGPGAQLTASNGELTLSAENAIRLETPRAIESRSHQLQLVAARGSLLFGSLALLGERLRLDLSEAALVARAVETFAESIATHARRVLRRSSELEQVQVAELQLRVDRTLDVRARDALLAAQKLFKLNGEQVHVG